MVSVVSVGIMVVGMGFLSWQQHYLNLAGVDLGKNCQKMA